MTIEQLTQKFQEIYDGSPWHGASLMALLSSIPSEHFTKIVTPGKKSIAHLLEHVLAWRQLAIEVLKGNQEYDIPINSDKDWPVPKPVGDAKAHYLSKLAESQESLLSILKTKDDDWLKEKTPNRSYINSYLMQGVVEHDLYHSGQIGIFNSLLKS
ncbi:DinB family protein [Reichenbachiella sp.]|uniref:DinB family protein n=1 Tax=Reichenbachiella sp. TaxID=2184521 RepID=UPI003BB167ED